MPTIPRRQSPRVGITEEPAAEFAPLGLGAEQHIAAQRMAMAAGDLAGVVGQMAALNARAKKTQELADFTAADAKGFNDFKISFGREVEDRLSDPQSTDPNFVGPVEPIEKWVEKRYKEWAKGHADEVTSGLSIKGARDEAAKNLKLADAGRIDELKLDALDREGNYIEASIPKTLMDYIQSGQAKGAFEYIDKLRGDGLLDAARATYWKQKAEGFEAEWLKEMEKERIRQVKLQALADAQAVGWDEAQELITDPAYQKEAGLTPDMAADVLRDVETLKRGAEERAEDERLKTQRENEGEMWGMWMDKRLTQGEVRRRFEEGLIDDTIRDDYIKRLRTRQPVITDDQTEWEINSAIRSYEQADPDYKFTTVEKMIYDNFNRLSDTDKSALQEKLYAAEKSLSKGDPIMKHPAVIAGFGTLINTKRAGDFIGLKPAKMEAYERRQNERAWRLARNEFDRWVRVNKDKVDMPDWEGMVEEKLDNILAPFAEGQEIGYLIQVFSSKRGEETDLAERISRAIKKGGGTVTEGSAISTAQRRAAAEVQIRQMPEQYRKIWEQAKSEGVTAEEFLEKMQSKLTE